MIIRRLNKDDLEVVFSLRLEALQQHPSAFLTSYEEELSRGRDFYREKLSSSMPVRKCKPRSSNLE